MRLPQQETVTDTDTDTDSRARGSKDGASRWICACAADGEQGSVSSWVTE